MTLPIDYGEFLRGFGSSKFVELLPIQRAVLHEYSAKFSTERDVAAEMPTGTGKSLVALLIAEAWRREGKKVAILSANKTLAHQMKEQEADFLGVQTVLMEGRGSDIPPAYRRSSWASWISSITRRYQVISRSAGFSRFLAPTKIGSN